MSVTLQYDINCEAHRPVILQLSVSDDINNPTSLVLFSIPGIPGAHQLTRVVLISMDGGQNFLTVINEKQNIG